LLKVLTFYLKILFRHCYKTGFKGPILEGYPVLQTGGTLAPRRQQVKGKQVGFFFIFFVAHHTSREVTLRICIIVQRDK
jgi:hypothetical protein